MAKRVAARNRQDGNSRKAPRGNSLEFFHPKSVFLYTAKKVAAIREVTRGGRYSLF